MPISPLVLQRRHAQLGAIRLGDKGTKGQPQKLTRFRITSPNQRLVESLAALYGGEARPWENGGKAEWEVYTERTSLPVIVVRGGLSQWLETWSGGGCQRRCDGEREMISDGPCICEEEAGDRRCKPTTRLSVMLRELDVIGVWKCESHGWNSAAELPGLVELAQQVGDLVPANLVLRERIQIKDGKTSKFVVPGLDLEVSPARLAAIVSGTTPPAAIEGYTSAAATIAPAPATDWHNWFPLVEDATTEDECRGIWNDAGQAGALSDELKAAINAKVILLRNPTTKQGDIDDLWFLVVAEAGNQDLTDSAVRAVFANSFGHDVADATSAELEEFLVELKSVAASPGSDLCPIDQHAYREVVLPVVAAALHAVDEEES